MTPDHCPRCKGTGIDPDLPHHGCIDCVGHEPVEPPTGEGLLRDHNPLSWTLVPDWDPEEEAGWTS